MTDVDSSTTAQLLARLAPADRCAAPRFGRLLLIERDIAAACTLMRDWSAGMVRRLAWDLDERGVEVTAQTLAPLVRQRVERLVSDAAGPQPFTFGRVRISSFDPAYVWMNEISRWTATSPPRLDEVDWEVLTTELMALPSRLPWSKTRTHE